MKKSIIFPVIFLGITCSTLIGCHQKDSRIRLSFGSYSTTATTEIEYGEFVAKMDAGENMIVVTYDSIYSIDCSCWTGFKKIVDDYVKDSNSIIYQIDRNEFEDRENYGLTLLKENSNPTCFVASKGKVTHEYRAGSKNNESIFTTEEGFKKAIEKVTKPAQVMLVDRAYLRNAIDNSDERVVVYQARAKCGDCNYCTPNCLLPFSETHEFKYKVLLMDLQVPGIYYDEDGTTKNDETYAAYKAEYQMTEATNQTYGYSTGVVPTFQVWEKGQLKDACVYFNDSLKKNDDGKWVVSETYYTENRAKVNFYNDKVLEGMEVPEEDITMYGEMGFWKQEAAAVYHNQILESFLSYYVKK